jgi:hypothetical protein
VQARQESQMKQEQSDLKHRAELAAVRTEQYELEVKRLRSILTESSDLQDSARRVRHMPSVDIVPFLSSSAVAFPAPMLLSK